MAQFVQFGIPVLLLTLVAGGWAGVQLLAKKMKTKNHIDQTTGCCGHCTGDGEGCSR